jgi:hypothetical protein
MAIFLFETLKREGIRPDSIIQSDNGKSFVVAEVIPPAIDFLFHPG